MAVITYKIPFWYQVSHLFNSCSIKSGLYQVDTIIDGDTFTVFHNNKRHTIRLLGVDAPEKDQDHGLSSKQMLSDLILNRSVYLSRLSIGRYRRVIALVHCDDTCINSELIRLGAVWVYDEYCPNDLKASWYLLMYYASRFRYGLWSLNNPVRPSVWRHR